MSVLIADSGSTKTDWCLMQPNEEPIFLRGAGMNPYIKGKAALYAATEILSKFESPSQIVFYGAGVKNEEKQSIIHSVLSERFPHAQLQVNSDMLGAARALCGREPGICAILGTGSNSCYYDGKHLRTHHPSLGYILGDEGAGVDMGKKVLQYYSYKTFEPELLQAFENKYGNDISSFLDQIYQGPEPNQYLASFVDFLIEQRGHYMIENIIEDCLVRFHERHLLKYRESWSHKINFVGSIAFQFADNIRALQQEYGLETGTILKTPMEGLLVYHTQKPQPA